MPKTLMVIGANSFSGQDFVDLALSENEFDKIVGVSRSPERSALFLRYKLNPRLKDYTYTQVDLNDDLEKLKQLFDHHQPEAVVNFAAQSEVAPSWEHPEDWFRTNTVSLAGMLKHLSRQKYLKRYLHISSPEVYGTCEGMVREDHPVNPSTPYAASKASADLLLSVYLKQFGFPLLTVRATNVYGARQQLFKIIPRTSIFLKLGKPIELHGGGQAVKSYIHIRDVSRGEMAVLRGGNIGELYHLSPDEGVAVKDVVRTICDLQGKAFDSSVKTVDERPGQDKAYLVDSAKARKNLGWKPQVTMLEGLREVSEWVEEYWDQIVKEPLGYVHKR
jgi:dTDP-glucose 4,6-dehydratase